MIVVFLVNFRQDKMVERIKINKYMKKHSDQSNIALKKLKHYQLKAYQGLSDKKSDFSAVIYLKGGCSNGNEPAKIVSKSAWMYYIETSDKQYEDYSESVLQGYTQNSMTLEAMIQAMTGAINLNINNKKLLFVTDYGALEGGITSWSEGWISNSWRKSKGFVEDIPRWKKIIFGVDDYFPKSEILCITKNNHHKYLEYCEGLARVTDFVDSKTEFV